MYILDGIKNFLELINNNWITIIVIIGLAIAIAKIAMDYFSKSNEEKVAIAKTQISQGILKLITDAELDYSDWASAGAIKRSQVINLIYQEYPILGKVINQEALIAWIDEQIDNALPTLREIIEKQNKNGTDSIASADISDNTTQLVSTAN